MTEVQSAYELTCSLREYNEQLAQVQELLQAEPDNEEYKDLQTNLREVIELTEDLLRSAQAPPGAPPGGAAAAPPPAFAAALPGFASGGPALLRTNWAPGEPCQALFTDGQWHPATVQAATSAGAFRVLFDHYAVPVTLPAASLRAAQRTGADEVYVGVPAPKRLKVDERLVAKEAPKRLAIAEGDDERTRERKKKLMKSFKSKQRLAEKEAEQNAKAQSWQAFRAGKGAPKSLKKESMFAVPEGGRVGVVGSGKGVTANPERRKNEFGDAA